MSDLLWQKPGVAVDAKIQAFLAGDDVLLDREFFLHDIRASRAHAQGLARIGILSDEELASLERELDALAGMELVHALGEHLLTHVDVLAPRVGDETEALIGVVPLHLADRHSVHLSFLLIVCFPRSIVKESVYPRPIV